ncbi:MAG: 4-alpha-glucanotransferase [Clostridia bacterium]|nr:4-alpha-glucanotransferase [Clostridia bacterium]
MPIFSLPTKYGIGDFGKTSYNFIDFLYSAKQNVWQVLPLVQTGFGNSPYSSICSYSFNPYFISLDMLEEEKLLTKKDLNKAKFNGSLIDYNFLYNTRYALLRKAFNNFNLTDKEFKKFLKENKFGDYALFMTIKDLTKKPFNEWEEELKFRQEKALRKVKKENEKEYLFYQFIQFLGQKQWLLLKKYANKKGVKIIGDMPLYTAYDSVDVWVNPKLFKLDENLSPTTVAGVPPDYFSKTGQLWGNPVYDYTEHEKTNFSWWKNRIKNALTIYDYVRIDHFRGLDRFYEIPAGSKDATFGEWKDVPSYKMFDEIKSKVNCENVIAEDLGIIDDGVRKLLKYTNFPGMKVLSFAFDGDENNLHLPKFAEYNSVCYTGTHDNDTLVGLINSLTEERLKVLKKGVEESCKLLGVKKCQNVVNNVIKLGFASNSKLFILPMQDLCLLGTEFRINEPSVVKEQNWAIIINKKYFSKKYIEKLKNYTLKYNRNK